MTSQGNANGQSTWSDQDRKEFAERHARLSKDLQAALDKAAKSERQAVSQKENIVELNARIIDLNAELSASRTNREVLKEAVHKAQSEGAQVRAEAEQLRQTLDGTHRTHHRTVSDLQEVMKEMREAPERGGLPHMKTLDFDASLPLLILPTCAH